MESRSKAFFDEASKKLNNAKEELFKPAEDLMSYSVCKNSQIAIENYLKGFLNKHNVELSSTETIETLYQKCILVDEKFKTLDLNALRCKGHQIDSRYCTDINTVSACFDAADSLDTFLRKNKIL